MKFQALMVSLDDAAAELLARILNDLGIEHERCSDADAATKFEETRLDLLVTTLDNTAAGEGLIHSLRCSSGSKTAIVLGLVGDRAHASRAFGAGANFVLYEPLSADNARATLRAAIALLQRERRRQFRVPVQLPVTLTSDTNEQLEGIMLDLSEGGMDVLSAKALQLGQSVSVRFCLPASIEMNAMAQVVWANANGQTGLQFAEFREQDSKALSHWLGTNAPQVPPDDPEPLAEYQLSDLSLGGCYIETLAPFPKNTRIDVCLRVGDFETHLDGNVRVVYPGHGMGVAFVPGPHTKELVLSLIERLGLEPGVFPDVLVWPRAINLKNASQDISHLADAGDDALLELLCSHNAMSQEEFVAELRRQRHSQPEVTNA